MSDIFKYRKSIITAKKEWDELMANEGKNYLKDVEVQKLIKNGSEISDLIKKEQETLDIYGGAVALLSKAKGCPYLLYSPQLQNKYGFKDDIHEYEFIDTPYSDTIEWREALPLHYFIDLLFFISRKIECPEYVLNIKNEKKSKFESNFQWELRQDFEILYCSSGEILVFLFFWRVVVQLIKHHGNPQVPVSQVKFATNNKPAQTWTWEELFEKVEHENCIERDLARILKHLKSTNEKDEIDTALDKAFKLLEDTSKQLDTYESIFKNIGFFTDVSNKHSEVFNSYAQSLFGINITLTPASKDIDGYVSEFFHRFVQILKKDNDEDPTLEQVLVRLHDIARFPILPYYFLMAFDKNHKLKEHLAFPIWFTFSPDTQYQFNNKLNSESAVVHGLYTIKPSWELKGFPQNAPESLSQEFFKSYLANVVTLFTILSKPIIDKEYYAKQRRSDITIIKNQAIRAAISQVMARNMSHNIGSHVMNKLLQPADIHAALIGNNYQTSFESSTDIIDALGVFNSYIKVRMDYLADITFGTPVMQTNKFFYREVFKSFDSNKLLLNNISALGGNFKYRIDFKFNGQDLSDETDTKASFPNDLLGCQAFYNILENIVRNTAKHSRETPDIVVFTIDICECNDSSFLYQVEVYDNVKHVNDTNCGEKERRLKEYNEQQTESRHALTEIDWIVFRQNNILNKSILDEKTYQLRTTSLGVIEMKSSAAYLRKLDVTQIESIDYLIEHNDQLKNKKGNLNVLKAFNKNGSLGYRFFILKPVEILVVGNYTSIDKDYLFKEGIWVLSPDEFRDSADVFNHQFLLYEDEDLSEFVKSKETSLPVRILKLNKSTKAKINVFLSKKSCVLLKLEECIWDMWSRKVFKSNGLSTLSIRGSVHSSRIKNNRYHAILLNHAEEWERHERMFKPYSEVKAGNSFSEGYLSYLDVLSSHAQQKLPGYENVFFAGDNKSSSSSSSGRHEFIARYYDYINGSALQNRIDYFKLSESILCKILVIDERIQEAALQYNYPYRGREYPFYKLYEFSNILLPVKFQGNFTPQKSIDLSAKNFTPEIIENIKDYINNHLLKCDFLLLHYSILERMFSSSKVPLNDYLVSLSSSINVVITSGRGKPSELPSCVRFVNLTPILDAFIDTRSKYAINYLLNSSRK